MFRIGLLFFSLLIFPLTSLQAEAGEIKVIVFDFGNIFVKWREGNGPILHFICEHFDVEPEEVLEEFKHGRHLSRVGLHEEVNFWHSFAANLQREVPEGWIQLLQDIYIEELVYNHGLHAFLDDLEAQGIQVALLSNQHASYSRRFREEGFFDSFEPQVISCDVGAAKPDPEIYHLLFAQLSASPEEILFIDDKEENLVAARSLGWQTLRYDFRHETHKELIEQLEAYGILQVQHMK